MPAAQWLAVFATTNIYFHLSTLYGIFRAKGVPRDVTVYSLKAR